MDKNTRGNTSKTQTYTKILRKLKEPVVQVVRLPQQSYNNPINQFPKLENLIFFAKTEIPTETADTTNVNHRKTRAPRDPIVA